MTASGSKGGTGHVPRASRTGATRAPSARPRRGAPQPDRNRSADIPSSPAIEGFCELMDTAPWNASIKDADGRYLYLNRHYLATLGDRFGSEWQGKTDAQIWAPDVAARRREIDALALGGVALPLFRLIVAYPDGPHTHVYMKFPLPTDDGRMVVAGVGLDVTEDARAEAEHDRLSTAIEQATASVEITDLEGRITYVNPAFERTTGYSRAEVLGQNPRILQSGVQSATFYAAMWSMLTKGQPWVADIVNRRKDGTLFTEEAVISPIHDSRGAPTGYVAVKRDVTQERAQEERSAALSRQRALISMTIRDLRAGDTPDATAQAVCRQVVNLPGIVKAQVFLFELDGRATPIGTVVADQADPPLRALPRQRSRHLRERAAEGPWVEPWVNRPWHPYNQLLTELGVHSVAYAPIRQDDRLIGLLIVDSPMSVGEGALVEVLPALVEFADLTGSHIGSLVAERTEMLRARQQISATIDRQAFLPVFQPIVDLSTDAVVGFEALTRFADGVAPDLKFFAAIAVGLGLSLEAATLEAALTAAATLPAQTWLDINVSPDLILEQELLRGILRRHRGRRLVLEVTEHQVVSDYPAFRAAIAAVDPKLELAVDDAGAGFASLRHILELRPAFVKLDRWLIADVDTDEARQAMIAGVLHFARSTGCQIIAEGIETSVERETLRALGVALGQGYLLGRPMPAGPS